MPNRLAGETSPYLLQHAGNPVDWHPWGEEALALAAAENRPVLLSIGYAACHWCHVMARECFEDPAIAALMNRLFINVKVDREERPDLDQFYQAAAQVLGSGGGWPLTVFCLPDGGPFFAGTYFPPEDRPGRPGLPTVMEAVARAYRERRALLEELARRVRVAVERLGRPGGAARAPLAPPGESAARPGIPLPGDRPGGAEVLATAVRGLLGQADLVHGGFGGAPKFPLAPGLALLLWAVHRLDPWDGETRLAAGRHALLSLRRMAQGGIHDQLGGGFHRYSVDAAWTVPHFEKMLFDNALLLPLYAAAASIVRRGALASAGGEKEWAATARTTAGFLLRDMAMPGGGFCASLDADSPAPDGGHGEGRFYTWTPAELAAVLGPAEGAAAARFFGVTEEGDVDGRSVLRLASSPPTPSVAGDGAAAEGGHTVPTRLASWRERLLPARAQRPAPARDDKVVAGWNGLAVSGLAVAGRLLAEPDWIEAAARAAAFVLDHLAAPGGGVLRSWRGRPAPAPGFLEDHAYLCLGLLDLHLATLEPSWLHQAHRLARILLERFWVREEGWFRTAAPPAGGERRGGRSAAAPDPAPWAEVRDGSLPAAGAAAVLALLRVHHATDDRDLRAAAEAALAAQERTLRRRPHACATLAMAWDLAAEGPTEVTLVGERREPPLADWLARLHSLYLPDLVLRHRPDDGPSPAATVCRRGACRGPLTSWEALDRLLTDPPPDRPT